MNNLNNLQQIIISSIGTEAKPLTGYDLTKLLKSVWSSSHQQVYRELKVLDKLGLLTFGVVEQEGKPAKKEYRLTKSGRDELARLSKEEITLMSFPPYRHEALAKVAVGNNSYFESLIAHSEKRIEELRNDQHELRQIGGSTADLGFMCIEREIMLVKIETDFARQVLGLTEKVDQAA